MAVMGELLQRRCNAAIPLVDIGTDVFAFRDDREDVARIQVKTAPGTLYKRGKGYYAKFGVPLMQLKRPDSPPLFYALAVRLENGWGSYILISRPELQDLKDEGCGSANAESRDVQLYIQFRPATNANPERADVETEQELTAKCGKFDLTKYINAWENLPPLKPLPIEFPPG